MGKGKAGERHFIYISKGWPQPEVGQSGKRKACPSGQRSALGIGQARIQELLCEEQLGPMRDYGHFPRLMSSEGEKGQAQGGPSERRGLSEEAQVSGGLTLLR